MSVLYTLVLVTHILTAIVGFGQTFLMPVIYLLPKTSQQIKFSHQILFKMGAIAKYSDWILFGSGALMVSLSYWEWKQLWILVAVMLFIVMRVSSAFLSYKTFTDLHQYMNLEENEIYLEEYRKKRKTYFPYLMFVQFLNLLIILDMILKPSF